MDYDIAKLLAAVVAAIKQGTPARPEAVFRVIADDLVPFPTVGEVAAVLRLLDEPALQFAPGEDPDAVIQRVRALVS
ncbi:hypothetical protein [Nocardia sp. NPDC052566]|uniref:hypothetical protein n=1 Tax=Nocardia sp. NPDC052566 TaxID=3364330 RepID=UPI0037CACC54